MGNQESEMVKTKRNQLRSNDQPLNVALVGHPGVGKSSLCNSFHRIITGRPEMPNITVSDTRGTEEVSYLAEVYECCKIRLFDMPGLNLDTLVDEDGILGVLLNGVQEGCTLTDLGEGRFEADASNKIDFAILVVTAENFANKWNKEKAEKLRRISKKYTGNEAFVIVTHSSVTGKPREHYLKHAFNVFPDGNLFLIDNYITTKDPDNLISENTIIDVFNVMLQRKRELELRNNQRLAKTKSLQSHPAPAQPSQSPLTTSNSSNATNTPPVAVVLPPEQPIEVLPPTPTPTPTPTTTATTSTLSAAPSNNARRISIGVYGGSRSAVSSEQQPEGVSRSSIGMGIDPLQPATNASPSRFGITAGAPQPDPNNPDNTNTPNPNCTSPRTWATFTKSQRK